MLFPQIRLTLYTRWFKTGTQVRLELERAVSPRAFFLNPSQKNWTAEYWESDQQGIVSPYLSSKELLERFNIKMKKSSKTTMDMRVDCTVLWHCLQCNQFLDLNMCRTKISILQVRRLINAQRQRTTSTLEEFQVYIHPIRLTTENNFSCNQGQGIRTTSFYAHHSDLRNFLPSFIENRKQF